MVEGKKLDTGTVVTAMIDSMVHALVDQMHAEDDERLREEIAFCEAIAETYGQKARLLRSLLKEQPQGHLTPAQPTVTRRAVV